MDQSEAVARDVRAIPDGVYEAESFMDDDGITSANASIKVRVTVAATA
jgi:N-methylhydantoinase B